MLQFIKNMLSENTAVSSKRVVGILAFLVIIIIGLVNMFTGKLIANFIFDGILYICLASLSLTTVEKFSDSFNKR
jgi:hypothetical protein